MDDQDAPSRQLVALGRFAEIDRERSLKDHEDLFLRVVRRALAAKLALQSTPVVAPDAVDRVKELHLSTQAKPIHSPDAFERAAAASNRIVVDDRFNAPVNIPVASSPTSSGGELEWPQIGLGFGLGIVLALGLFLAMHYTRTRPLAH